MIGRRDKSDRDVSAGPPTDARPDDDAEAPARWLEQSEALETFDETTKRRFGKVISTAVLKPRKRR
jgi:hypothetical protein